MSAFLVTVGWAALAWLLLAAGAYAILWYHASRTEPVDPVDDAFDTLPAGRPELTVENHERLDVDDLWREVTHDYIERMWALPEAEVQR